MKIAILFDGASAYASKPDQLILGTVEAIEKSLVAEGNAVGYIPVHLDGKWIEKLRRGKFDLAFNMCEGIDGIATLEPAVISVLELFKIPFTGATSYSAAICLRKHLVNGLLERAGLPIPAKTPSPWFLISSSPGSTKPVHSPLRASRRAALHLTALCRPEISLRR